MSATTSVDSIPFLPRGVRLHEDSVRGVPVLLGPERAMMLDEIGHAILSEIDGVHTLGQIAQDLSARYDAPNDEVVADVTAFLDDLADRQMVRYRNEG
jgi:pyrroloquinoline quinone biosynthesis protein D